MIGELDAGLRHVQKPKPTNAGRKQIGFPDVILGLFAIVSRTAGHEASRTGGSFTALSVANA
jgi:hypothetical protein